MQSMQTECRTQLESCYYSFGYVLNGAPTEHRRDTDRTSTRHRRGTDGTPTRHWGAPVPGPDAPASQPLRSWQSLALLGSNALLTGRQVAMAVGSQGGD